MTRFRGVIFDKDGTLFDFSKTWEAWAVSLMRRIATDEAQAIALGKAVGFDLATHRFAPDSVAIAGTPVEIANQLMTVLPHSRSSEIVNIINEEASKAPQMEVVPLRAYVNGLRNAGYRLGVVTNDAEQPARAHLDAANVTALFDFVAGSDSGWGAKPDAGQLLACARFLELRPDEMVMVGDSTHDLIAARRAGMTGVGVLTGLAGATALDPYADAVLPDIGHLPSWLDAQNNM